MEYSGRKHRPENGLKIWAVKGENTAGYLLSEELKEWVDSVLAFDSIASFPATGADGVLYIAKDENVLYRWDGSQYVSVSADTSELEAKVEELEAQVEDLQSEVEEQQKTIADHEKDIAMLKFANEGKTYIMEESDRDGYTVDVKPSTVTGTAFGEAVLKSMEGRDVCWNQLIDVDRIVGTTTINGVTWTVNSDNSVTANGTATALSQFTIYPDSTEVGFKGTVDHKYLNCLIDNPTSGIYGKIINNASGIGSETGAVGISTCTSTRGAGVVLRIDSGVTASHVTFRPYMVDLTLAFPTDTPTSLSDPRIAWLKAYLAEHPEYNAGQIVNNNVTSVVSRKSYMNIASYTGGTWGIIESKPLDPSKRYKLCLYANGYTSLDRTWLFSLRKDGSGIDNIYNDQIRNGYNEFEIGYADLLRFSNQQTYSGTLTDIKLVADDPFATLSLPSICSNLHGVGTARDKVSFVNRKYENMKSVDLGTLEWEYDTSTQRFSSTGLAGQYVPPINGLTPANAISNAIPVVSNGDVYDHRVDLGLSLHESNGKVWVYDKSKVGVSASAFKTSLSGVILHYEATSGGQRYEARVKTKVMSEIVLNGTESYVATSSYIYCNTQIAVGKSNGYTPTAILTDCVPSNKILWFDDTHTRLQFMDLMAYISGMSSNTDVAGFKAYLAQHPMHIIYELATPQLLDITSLVPEEPSLPIEDGGTLTFVNENKVATPFTMSMPVKLGGTV